MAVNNLDPSTLISQYIASSEALGDSKKCCDSLVELMVNKKLSLLEFIQHLGPSLTSDNDLIRLKSITCLVEVLDNLNGQVLTKQDVNVLLDFLIVKVEDKHCLFSVLRGLRILVKFNSFIPSVNDNLLKLINALLLKYDPRKNLAKVRYEAFLILQIIFACNLDFIKRNKDISTNCVKLFIHIATSEKDPRNLIISFELNTTINQNIEFDDNNDLDKEFINDLFDVCFCYFPISFTPPKNDPYKITADELKGKLRLAIASQSLFAKDAFSSLNEKLTSTNPAIRNDVLKTLLLCIKNYSLETIVEYWLTIWNAVKFEILHNDVSIFKPFLNSIIPDNYDENIEDTDDNKSLIITLVIISELDKRLIESDQHQNFLSIIEEELKPNLALGAKPLKQSVLVLSSLASDSFESFNFITKSIFAYLAWGKYIGINSNETEEDNSEIDKSEDLSINISMQKDLVDNLGFVILAYNILINSDNITEFQLANNELTAVKDHLLIFMGQLLQSSSNLEKALNCKVIQQLIKLMKTPRFLDDAENSLIFGYFNELLVGIIHQNPNSFHKDVVVKEILHGLISIMTSDSANLESGNNLSDRRTKEVVEFILPVFLNALNFEDNFDKSYITNILDSLEDLCVNYQLLEVLTIRLLNKLEYLVESDVENKLKYEVFEAIVELFNKAIYKTEVIKQFLTNSLYKTFIPRFLNLLINLIEANTNNISLIESSGELIGLIIKFTDKSRHQLILDEYKNQFLYERHDIIETTIPSLNKNPSYIVSLFNRVLSNLDKSVVFEDLQEDGVIFSIIDLIYTIDDEYLRVSYLQNLALLINKFLKSSEYNDVKLILERIYVELNSSKSSIDRHQTKELEVLIWITKALIIRIDPLGVEYVKKLILLLSNENLELKVLVSQSLNILFVELPIFTNQTSKIKGIISKVSNLNTRLLYEQKIFELLLPELKLKYSETKDEIYLSSLSLILQNLSSKVLRSYIEEVFPLILNSLLLKNPDVLRATLGILDLVITEKPDLISPHLSTIIPTLSRNVVRRKYDEEIRILSLRCLLDIFNTLPYTQLIKYQSNVLKDLTKGLDDPKRKVRKLCCDIRQLLYEIGK